MARDTKLRMSIDPKIVERLNQLEEQIKKATEHSANKYELRKIRLPIKDSTDYILFHFGLRWCVRRCSQKEDMYDKMSTEGWEIQPYGDEVIISTLGKMAVDINREIEEQLVQVQIQIDLIENPVYCPKCDHCGETGCCGFIGFLESHVRGKTDCLYEDEILNDLEEWIKDKDD